MDFLGPFHPQLTHFPVALVIVSVIFEIVGRLTDLDWWRKAAFVMLIFGVLGAGVSILSGNAAEEGAEDQHVPEAAIEEHEEAAYLTLWLGLGAIVARLVAGRVKKARVLTGGIALALQLAAAVVVGVTGHRGGELVFKHGAAVKVQAPAPPAGGAAGEAAPAPGGTAPEAAEKDKDKD